ncbi:MAG: ATP-binding protein, partial [Spirochaetota bacterium]|nr:ATP-binding protein [Spirochaetota bacterium]
CDTTTLLNEFDFRATLSLKSEGISFGIKQQNISDELIISSEAIQYLLDIFTEVLNNISKHSHANNVIITVSYSGSCLAVTVEDNGVGFQVDSENISNHSYGLTLMRQYSEQLGAKFSLTSTPGTGTTVSFSIAVD